MATGVLIPRIPTDPPLFVAEPTKFSEIVANDLGDLGTAADGFDVLFAIPWYALDGDLAGLTAFDDLLGIMDFVDGAFDSNVLLPLLALLTDLEATGDALFALQDLLLLTKLPNLNLPGIPASPVPVPCDPCSQGCVGSGCGGGKYYIPPYWYYGTGFGCGDYCL